MKGGNTLGTLDSAGIVDPKVKSGLNTGGVGRDPLVEIGGNKFGKLKLEDTGVGRGPLVEIGEGDPVGIGLPWEGLEHFGVLGDTVSRWSSLDILGCSSVGDKALF